MVYLAGDDKHEQEQRRTGKLEQVSYLQSVCDQAGVSDR